jgi:hypothetical protein
MVISSRFLQFSQSAAKTAKSRCAIHGSCAYIEGHADRRLRAAERYAVADQYENASIEKFRFDLEGVGDKNLDGSRRQDHIAALATGEELRFSPGEKTVPEAKRVIAVFRSSGQQVGEIRGATASQLARPGQNEWVDVVVAQVHPVERRFRKPLLGVTIEVRRYRGQLPTHVLRERAFRSMRFHFDPGRENDPNLLQAVGEDLDSLGLLNGNPLDRHYQFDKLLRAYYRERNRDPDALVKAIMACQMQIAISEDVRREILGGPVKKLPRHSGYELLATIREKQRQYDDTIELCSAAQKQGWEHDWAVRILRCKKKLEKQRKKDNAGS